MGIRRDTCLYCDTPLIPYQHWGICPKCEPDFLKRITPLTVPDLLALHGAKPSLIKVGLPTRGGVKQS